MPPLQIGFLALTVLLPILLIAISRRCVWPGFDHTICRLLAIILLATEIGEMFVKLVVERMPFASALPMHLCDWALICTVVALWTRRRAFFDLAYFWGLAGTTQGLLAPALPPDLALWRQIAFYFIHSGIVVSVCFLVGALRFRPILSSLGRTVLWSWIYLAAALLVNALTRQNFGFLAHPPITASLLDQFSTQHWLYVAEINATAFAFFAVLYAPWAIADRLRITSEQNKTTIDRTTIERFSRPGGPPGK